MNEQMNHSVNQQILFMAPIEEKYSCEANRTDNWFHKGHTEWDSVPESTLEWCLEHSKDLSKVIRISV